MVRLIISVCVWRFLVCGMPYKHHYMPEQVCCTVQVEALFYAYAGELVAVGPSVWCFACGEQLPQIGSSWMSSISHRVGNRLRLESGLHPQAVINGALCMKVIQCNVVQRDDACNVLSLWYLVSCACACLLQLEFLLKC